MTDASTVVIGIGHPYRNDDAAGLAVLAHLAAADCRLVLVPSFGEPTELIDAWTGRYTAVLVDALRHPGADPGRVRRIVVDRADGYLDSGRSASSSHGIELGDTLALARALDRLPYHLIVYAIEVEEVGFGDTLSAPVAEAAQLVADAIRSEFG